MDDDEGAKKVLSSSFAGIVHAFVHSSQTLQHVTDAMSSFEGIHFVHRYAILRFGTCAVHYVMHNTRVSVYCNKEELARLKHRKQGEAEIYVKLV